MKIESGSDSIRGLKLMRFTAFAGFDSLLFTHGTVGATGQTETEHRKGEEDSFHGINTGWLE